MMIEFEMKDIGLMSHFIGLQVHKKIEEKFLLESKYAHDMLKKFIIKIYTPVTTPTAHEEYLCKEDGDQKVNKKSIET